jgi:hypothetical protein
MNRELMELANCFVAVGLSVVVLEDGKEDGKDLYAK